MKNISLLRKCIITVLGLCLILVSVLLFAGVKKASAFSLGTFEMDSGMYIKTKDFAGLRARVRMDSDTKSVIDEENNSLFFLLMTEDMFNAAETETSGEYDFSSYLNYNNFDTYGCVKIGANKNLIYYSSSDASYYSNLLIRDFPEKYLTIRLCIVAGITDGTNTEIAAFEPSQVCKVYYDVVNDAALSGFMSQINGIETYSSWYGTSGYPIVINNDSQYEDLRQIIMADINLSNKFIDISDNVERDQEFEEFSSITNKIAEEVDVNFDFDLSLSSSQGANIKQIDTNLAVADIQSVSLMNGTKIAFTRNTDTSELDFTSETINSLAKGDIPVRIGTSNKLYKARCL